MSLRGAFSFRFILSHILSMVLTRLSILGSEKEVEGMASSQYVTFFSDLILTLFSTRLASALIATFCISSKVVGSLSLSWYVISGSKPSGNFTSVEPSGGFM